ncbi:YbgC/FadM family acyl-CoA thioesterase [Parvularcula sp. ZS-1/3]|uniref:YbgC/FadM family acyl-CoA thioesterase n=1 Tax=Parvularcula mediterranea TaxID=2732508 RepID=A0A7Y3RM23_9PROT|nr:YbgC/FadM family acyl-CoA thioesterase [Parvularcula mediterranea]NNU16046.1 YbgC/FadM family acyl-CoA thioesterase [Parvularcula mediterranea]
MHPLRTTRQDYRIYFEDTDVTGIVYHANYIKYFERGRTEALRASFSDLGALMETDDPCTFAVASLDIAYKVPAKLDDIISVETTLESAKGAKMVFDQKIFRGETLLAEGKVVVAVITLDGRPRRMPEAMKVRMAELTA